MPDPNLRASDADRTAVAQQLGRALSDGRLTVAEYDERVSQAWAARTYGDLDGLLADLPDAVPATQRPAAAPAGIPAPRPAGACASPGGRGAWASWVTTAVIVTAIWLITTIGAGVHYFWPIWVIGPWGAVLLARTVLGTPARRDRHDRRSLRR
jgi:hypothetical protein